MTLAWVSYVRQAMKRIAWHSAVDGGIDLAAFFSNKVDHYTGQDKNTFHTLRGSAVRILGLFLGMIRLLKCLTVAQPIVGARIA